MTMFLLVSFLCLSVIYTAASTVDTAQNVNTDSMEYLIRRIEVLENRDLQFREEMRRKQDRQEREIASLRRVQDRQGREIDSLRRVLGSRIKDHGQGNDETVQEDENKHSSLEVSDAISTGGENLNSIHGMHRIRRAEVDMNVAFFAKLTHDITHLGQNQIIAFDTIETNEGNAYNPLDGVFTAPVSGTYVFATTVVTQGRDETHYGFDYNGNVITTMYVNGAESYYESSSQTIVLQLNQGELVTIKHIGSDKTLYGHHYSIFSGFLLRQSYPGVNVVGIPGVITQKKHTRSRGVIGFNVTTGYHSKRVIG